MLKKLPTLLHVLFLSLTLYSQDSTANTSSEKGKYTLELQLRPNFNGGSWISGGSINFRYFPKVNRAFRISYSPFFNLETIKIPENFDGSGKVGTQKTTNTSNFISAAYEYHLGKNSKFSPYLGYGISFSIITEKSTGENTNGSSYYDDYTYESKQITYGIGAFAIAGFDWYVLNSMYLGVQFSLGFAYQSVEDLTATSVRDGVERSYKILGSTSFVLSDQYLSGIRLGWRF